MSYDPDAPIDPTQDYQRALAYGTWASKFKNGGAPDGLGEYTAWGHVARWLAQKAETDLNVRGMGITAHDLLERALVAEPTMQLGLPPALYNNLTLWHGPRNALGENSRSGQGTLRGMLLWGFNRSSDKVIETWGKGPQLATAVARAIETDPDPLVRLEALKAVAQASFPAQRWANAVLPALDRAQATLAEQPWNTTTRRALQKWISDVRARLLTLLALAAQQPNPAAWVAPPAKLGVWSFIKHNPLPVAGIGLGVVIAGLLGVRAWQGRQRRLAA